MPREYRAEEMRWIAENTPWLETTHPGKWIAVQDSDLIAVGEDAVEVMAACKAKGVEHPLLDVVRSLRAQTSIVVRTLHKWK